jgi:exodeoxyribonuclease V alpha subunit
MNAAAPERSATPTDKLSGVIERVTFFNEESGFCVLRIKAPGHREEVTVIGSLPSVSAGEWLSGEGWWVRDKEHGLQFKASTIRTVPPTTVEGIEKYLGSGLVKGIGPVMAKRLVGRFKADVLSVIETRPGELLLVDGIGAKRRERISRAWREAKQVREIMLFLHGHGVSTSKAVRIFKAYGEEAIEKVRSNPYTLAKDIYGIGFATADLIAQKLGIPKDSLNRARAGLDHVLLEATSDGHCALPMEKLKVSAVKLLEVPEATVEEALSEMLTSGHLLLVDIDGEPLIFLPHLRKAEEAIAAKFKQLANAETLYPPMDFEKAVVWCQQKRQDPRPEPERGTEDRSHKSCRDHHRRAGCGQDHAGELDSDDTERQEGEVPPLCAHWTGGKEVDGNHRVGSQDHSPIAGSESRHGAVQQRCVQSTCLRTSGH